MSLLLLGIIVMSLVQIASWWVRGHSAAALIGGVFLVSYPVDLLVINVTGASFLAYSVPRARLGQTEIESAAIFMLFAWLLFTIAVLLAKRPEDSSVPTTSRAPRLIVFAILTGVLAVIGIRSVLAYGVSETLTSRQIVFGGSALALLVYFAMPVLAVIGAYGALSSHGTRRLLFSLGTLIALGMVGLSGSRTSLAIAILAILALLWRHGRLLRHSRRRLLRSAIVAASLALPILLVDWYLRNVRGVGATQSQGSLLGGPDVSQADVLVSLIRRDAPQTGSYLAGPFWFVPREIWEGKPLPGNAVTSLILTPGRYLLTGAETTAGVLGEAFLNAGWWGFTLGALILAVAAVSIQRLLSSPDMATWCLGVVLLLRSVNLVRGDLTNFIAPTSVAILVWLLLFPRLSVKERKTAPAGVKQVMK